MLALYRAGRQRDAFRVYHETRLALVEELGLEPGEELRALERMILAHDPRLLTPRAADEESSVRRAGADVVALVLSSSSPANRPATVRASGSQLL